MISCHTVKELRERIREQRLSGVRIALVPTMGNLHAGHLKLVQEAKKVADFVVASVFVNPLQFGPNEDFESYPRTLDSDSEKLAALDLDLVFAPSVDEVYPGGEAVKVQVLVPGISEILCGESRPGHFTGVATVVSKLLNMVQPDLAVFGEKDYQQLLVIKNMAAGLDMPVEILGVPTVREADGLAMSSRNAYLSVEERNSAPALYQCLNDAAQKLQSGRRDFLQIKAEANQKLSEAGFKPDYFAIRKTTDLCAPEPNDKNIVILAAARLGKARLIDNLPITLQS